MESGPSGVAGWMYVSVPVATVISCLAELFFMSEIKFLKIILPSFNSFGTRMAGRRD